MALLFLLPTQLAYHIWPTYAFVFGIRVDYLAPTIYLTDFFIMALVVGHLKMFKKYLLLIVFVLTFGLINSYFSALPLASLSKWVKIFEAVFLSIYIINQKVVSKPRIIEMLFYSSIFFSLIGIIQFLTGGTLSKILYFLGERSFNLSTPGIALVTIWGRQFLRAYSTFSHPNSLAGYLGIIIILTSTAKSKSKWFFVGLLIVVVGFLLTFSLTAFFAMVVVYLVFVMSKNVKLLRKLSLYIFGSVVLVSTTLPIWGRLVLTHFIIFKENIAQRLSLAILSGKMISQTFLLGGGLNTFIIIATKLRGLYGSSWLMQPVHNVFLLTFSETGIIGLLVISYLFYKLIINNEKEEHITLILCVLFILITGFADHYWLTLQQNIFLFALIAGLLLRFTASVHRK